MKRTVYLAGPITGHTYGAANNWRNDVIAELGAYNIRGISPLRCEPIVGEHYQPQYTDPRFGTPRAIASKNLFDVQQCDMTLAYMPAELNQERISLGTISELAWARALDKPTILVSDDDRITGNPVVQSNAGWIVTTLDEGLDIVTGILSEYAR
jgi:nucleoside 2-deoxyribosyltransferase